MQPTFTQDDLALLREAAGMLMCHLETGSVELTRADMRTSAAECSRVGCRAHRRARYGMFASSSG